MKLRKQAVKIEEELPDFSLAANRKDLNAEELEAEEKAEVVSIRNFKRIEPVIGTLAFYLRQHNSNEVINIIKNGIEKGANTASSNLIRLVKLYEKLDEYSKKRIDIFDHLCAEFNITPRKFWGWFQEGLFEEMNMVAKYNIAQSAPELTAAIAHFGKKEKNFKDRELGMKMAGLMEETPLVKIEDNSIHNTQVNNFPIKSFSSSIRASDEVIRGNKEIETNEQRQLEAGNSEDFIEGEFVETKLEEVTNARNSNS